jgi:hypothetical protein
MCWLLIATYERKSNKKQLNSPLFFQRIFTLKPYSVIRIIMPKNWWRLDSLHDGLHVSNYLHELNSAPSVDRGNESIISSLWILKMVKKNSLKAITHRSSCGMSHLWSITNWRRKRCFIRYILNIQNTNVVNRISFINFAKVIYYL